MYMAMLWGRGGYGSVDLVFERANNNNTTWEYGGCAYVFRWEGYYAQYFFQFV